MKKNVKVVLEYCIVFLALLFVCFFVNRAIVIKGLYMDDLFHWAWYPGLSFYEFALKFYEGSGRYRPVFDGLQYLIYIIVGNNPLRFSIVNKVFNTIVAFFVYYFARRLNVKGAIAFLVSAFYLVAHFAYYQISQSIGTLETCSLFLALMTLYFCMKLVGVTNHNVIEEESARQKSKCINVFVIYLLYFLVCFTHERYLGLAVVIIFAILFSEKNLNKFKLISLTVFIIEILLICLLRYIAIGKVLPSGTGGTYVEETFKLVECIKFCFIQVLFIFGINVGPDYLYGVDFFQMPGFKIKLLTGFSILVIFVIIVTYIYRRIKCSDNKNRLAADVLFLTFIAMCIGASSVTIRVEMRFMYVSFIASVLYLAYMCQFISRSLKIDRIKIVPLALFVIVFLSRVPIELRYRSFYNNIHCIVDLNRMNSLYDLTIGRYGVDEILHNKKIYILNKVYGMTNFYAEYFYKIYDKTNIGNKINLINEITEIPESDLNENTIIIFENYETNVYTTLQ